MDNLAELFQVCIMAIVQGIGEFLPISSSGHLLVLAHLFGIDDPLTLSILLHAGTLLSVLVFFARDLIEVFIRRQKAIWLVFVGSIPTVAIAFFVMKKFEFLESSRLATGLGFLVTALLLVTLARKSNMSEYERYYEEINMDEDELDEERRRRELKSIENTSTWDAFVIGISQGLAVLPGLSRSGSTISTALARKLNSEWAAEFSFFLSIPVIAGGAALEILKLVKTARDQGQNFLTVFSSDPQLGIYAIGAVISFVVGWISLYGLMRMLKAGKLHYFAIWLVLIGIATLSWTVLDHWTLVVEQLNQWGLGSLVMDKMSSSL